MYTNSNYRALLCVAMKGISIWSAFIDLSQLSYILMIKYGYNDNNNNNNNNNHYYFYYYYYYYYLLL